MAAFDYRAKDGIQVIEVASFGEKHNMPNMSCRLGPVIQNMMVGRSGGIFSHGLTYNPYWDSYEPVYGPVVASYKQAADLLPSATLHAPVVVLRGASTIYVSNFDT